MGIEYFQDSYLVNKVDEEKIDPTKVLVNRGYNTTK